MLFVEAMRKFATEMKEVNLTEAYRLALPTFKDRLEQVFVVLKDSESEKMLSGSNAVPIGNKRPAEDQPNEVDRSKKVAN